MTALGSAILLTLAVSGGYPAGSFTLSSKEVEATLTSLRGVDGGAARMTGKVTLADAREYCGRDPDGATVGHGGRESKAQCAADQLRQEHGKIYRASADCTTHTIASTVGTFTYAGGWRGKDGQVLDGSNASGAPTVDAQFTTLCPASAKVLKIGSPA